MPSFNFFNLIFGNNTIHGTDRDDLIIGTFGDDNITAKDGDDLVFGLFGNDKIAGDLGDDMLFGGFGDDTVEGGDGDDYVSGGFGNDRVVGNKGDDEMFGGRGDDLLVWNNGDGSDLMDGGKGYDIQQVNFDTDLVNDDLQNDDVAEFSVTDEGIQFARIEVNGQTERGLFQLDIRNTEVQETNFGGGEDTAVITGDVLNKIKLDLDGGDGVDTLDLSQAAEAVKVNLKKGTLNDSHAVNFENVVGTIFDDKIRGDKQDNILSGNDGDDKLFGKGGDDTIIGNKGDDEMFGGRGDDLLVWNNGDGS
uniref:calcium-binding protein n=1 Tax=uncultured Roseobacter sp. TaxID=114847 RepID=UPI00260AAEBC